VKYPCSRDTKYAQASQAGMTNGWVSFFLSSETFHLLVRVGATEVSCKQMYMVTRFVTLPKKKRNQKKDQDKVRSLDNGDAVHTPATGDSTPESNDKADSSAAINAIVESSLSKEEPDGAILNCTVVSELCLKIGRTTMPPAFVLALNGYSVPSANGEPYSRQNPPPHMEKIRDLLGRPQESQAFLRRGLREVPLEDRWWEHALGGAIEEKRKRTLELVQGVRHGMTGARVIY
jgi:hypothetical protein